MKTMDQTLPEELLLQPDGHLTETALTCVADGELDLLPAIALAHLDECDHCSHRLGEAALLSLAAGEALQAARAPALALVPVPATPAPVAAAPVPTLRRSSWGTPPNPRARRPLPVLAIAAALILALVSAGPALLDALGGVPSTLAGVVTGGQFLLRVGAAFVRAPWAHGSAALLVKLASALVMAAIGLQVARITSRSASWQQGGV